MIDEKKLIEDIEKEFDGVCVYDVSPSQAIADFIEIVDRQPKVGEWIPCSERLPKETDYYLVTGQWKGEEIKTWVCEFLVLNSAFGGGWCNSVKNPIVDAWMPLPTPYKEDMRGGKNE